jgi:PKD repeat protein
VTNIDDDTVFHDIFIDDGDLGTSYTGTWNESGGTSEYDGDSKWARNGATYTWQFDSQPPGIYEVLMRWSGYHSRATNIEVEINYHGGHETVTINQQENAGEWKSLGEWCFDSTGSVTIIAADGGTVSTCADAVWFRLISENTPPTASIDLITPKPAEPGQPVQFIGQGTDPEGFVDAYQWESSIDELLSNSAFFTTSSLTEGTHTISFRVQDNAGCWSETVTEVLVVGAIPTEIIIDNRDGETSQTGTWAVSGGADPYDPYDPDADSVWSRDGSTFTWRFTPPQSGNYEVSMWWTEWQSRSTSVPVDIEHSDGTTTVSTPVYIDQRQNGGRWNNLGKYPFESGVSYNVTITAQPGSSSSTCADAVRFNFIQSNDPPAAIIDSITPNPANVGDDVTFSGHGEDTDGTVVAYSWDSSIDEHLSDEASFSWVSLSEGEHIITFRVQDNEGEWSAFASETLIVGNIPPVAYIDSIAPNPANVGEDVTFSGHGEDTDGTVVAYSWDSSIDEHLSDAASFTTSTLSKGTHTITFTVYDNDGAGSEPASQTLSIQEIVTEVVIDNGDPLRTSYTGTWSNSSGSDPYGTTSLWARDGATYTWTFSPTVSGYYEVSMWWTEWPSSRSTSVPVYIEHSGGRFTDQINQQENGGAWNCRGVFPFEAGSSYNVTVTAQPGPSSTCADAVKFTSIQEVDPPTAIIDSISPSPVDGGQSVTFSGDGEAVNGTIVAYSWDSNINGHLSDESSFSTSTLSSGDHTITFTAYEVYDGGDCEIVASQADATLLTVNAVPVEPVFACFGYSMWNSVHVFISWLEDIGAQQLGSVWFYEENDKLYNIEIIQSIEGMKRALTTKGAHVLFEGHSNYGLGPIFATQSEQASYRIDDLFYVDDRRILNYSSPCISVSIRYMRTGQAYPNWWSIFQDGTSATMPYDFEDDRGDPPYNYYPVYQVEGDPDYYKIENVSNSAIERFPDSYSPAWYSRDGDHPHPDDADHQQYYITNPAPWSPSCESIGDWIQAQTATGYYKENYVYSPAGQGSELRWIFTLPEAGAYEVFAWWPGSDQNTSNAPYTVNHVLDGEPAITTVEVDQRVSSDEWYKIGEFDFDAGECSVIVRDDVDAGNVVADGVRIAHKDNPPDVVQANFRANIRYGVAPLDVTFTNQGSGDLTDRRWKFGDGVENGSRDYITHTYTEPGTYEVSLTVYGPLDPLEGDTKTKTDYITVGDTTPILQAEFSPDSISSREITVDSTVNFRDRSSGNIVSRLWNFGDCDGDGYDETSSLQRPSQTYSKPGNYAVSLTVTDANGVSSTETKENFIKVNLFLKDIDNVDYPKTHFRSKTILFREDLEIPEEELRYERMLYISCNSGNYYTHTFHRGIMFYTLQGNSLVGGQMFPVYLRAYFAGKSNEEIWEILQDREAIYDFYDFNKKPPSEQ